MDIGILSGELNSKAMLQHASLVYSRFLSSGDPRVSDWAMMSTPMPTFALIAVYLFVVWWGQKAMAARPKGFELRHVMVVYNSCLVVLSGWLCYEFCVCGWFSGSYTFGCQPVDLSMHPEALRMARTCWVFYISKLIELADTIFFVLRKRFQLITFLHVFHHAAMAASWWFGVKFVPGGFGTFHAVINSGIHFMMYSYYALAAAGPQFQPYLWWKRYLTSAQILQFIVIIMHTMQLFFFEDCDYPIIFGWWILLCSFIFLGLFGQFYVREYLKPKASRKLIEAKNEQLKEE